MILRRNSLFTLLSTIVALSIVAPGCGGDDDDAQNTTPQVELLPVDKPGPYNTGFRSWDVTYQPEGVDAPRTIKMNVWYPTNDKDGTGPLYLDKFGDDLSFTDASLAPPRSGATYPVHVFSHGFSGYGGVSNEMSRYFASHGWVVAAPDHTLNTLDDISITLPTSLYFLRSMDASKMLDELENLPASDPLAGKVDTKHALLSGHSFGSFTCWSSAGATFDIDNLHNKLCKPGGVQSGTCTDAEIAIFQKGLRDERFVASIPMAGDGGGTDWHGDTGFNAVKIPTMMMSAEANPVGDDKLFELITGVPLTWVELSAGCHDIFTSLGCPDQKDLDESSWQTIHTYMLAFARKHVLGDTTTQVAGILDGTTKVSDRITLKKKLRTGVCRPKRDSDRLRACRST